MATLLPNRYTLDITGESPNNLVSAEPCSLLTKKVRIIAPLYAPFFKASLVITDNVSHQVLNSTQYKCLNIIALPSALAGVGNDVYALIAITDQSVSNSVTLRYQALGGDYTRSYAAVKALLDNLSGDTRAASWPNIFNRPDTFDPALHLHAVGDTLGWEYMVTALEELRAVVLLGDAIGHDQILSYIDQQTAALTAAIALKIGANSPLGLHQADTANPHQTSKYQVGLGLVENYPVASTLEASTGTATDRYMTPELVAALVAAKLATYADTVTAAVAAADAAGYARGYAAGQAAP